LHIIDLYGNPGNILAIGTMPFQMYVLLLSASDQHANTEKLPSHLTHRVHQTIKLEKPLSVKYTADCSWLSLLNFLAAGMTIAHP